MNIRKGILVAAFCLLTTLSYGQTKEETITWLKEKFGSYLKGGYTGNGVLWYKTEVQSFQINECELFVKYKETTSFSGGQTSLMEVTIPIKNLRIDDDGYFVFEHYIIKSVETQSTYSQDNIGKPDYIQSTRNKVEIDFSREENIKDRIQNALTNLASFCPEKKKETF